MIVAVFRRRLRHGMTFDNFKHAWQADQGFGVRARVFAAVNVDDPRDVLTVGFVDIPAEGLQAGVDRVAAQESERHTRIDDVIESTELKAMYDLASEHDFTSDPREIAIGSPESLLSGFSDG